MQASCCHFEHMGVNHCGSHIAVAQQLLYRANVGARLQQVGVAPRDCALVCLQGRQAGPSQAGATDAATQPRSGRVGPGLHDARGPTGGDAVSVLQDGNFASGSDFSGTTTTTCTGYGHVRPSQGAAVRHQRKRLNDMRNVRPCMCGGRAAPHAGGQDARHRVTVVPVWFGAVTRANTARAVVCAGRNGAGRGHHLSQS